MQYSDAIQHSQHEEIITRVTFTSRHSAEDFPTRCFAEEKSRQHGSKPSSSPQASFIPFVSLVLHLYLLEDFDEQLQSHLFDNANEKLVQSVVEHRRDFDVLAPETHGGRFALYNQCKSRLCEEEKYKNGSLIDNS